MAGPFINPVVYQNTAHTPAADGAVLDPKLIPLDATGDKNYIVKNNDEGIAVRGSDIVSTDADNTLIVGQDGGLFVKKLGVSDFISTEAGNQLTNNNGIYYNVGDYVSVYPTNILEVDVQGRLLVKAPEQTIVSEDTGNFIREGTDSAAYLGVSEVVSVETGNLLTQSALDGKLIVHNPLGNINDIVSTEDCGDESCNLLSVDSCGRLRVNSKTLLSDISGQLLELDSCKLSLTADNLISTDNGNIIEIGGDGKLVAIETLPCVDDNVLAVTDDGCITATLSLAYDTITGKFDIVGKDGSTIISTVTVPSSVSMLQSADLVINPSGQPEGTYMHFTLLLADGTTTDIYVDVTSLIDIYLAGDGIVITDNTIATCIVTDGGLRYTTTGCIEVDKASLLSDDTANCLHVGSDGGFIMKAVSQDTGNSLVVGSDCAAYFSSDYGTMD